MQLDCDADASLFYQALTNEANAPVQGHCWFIIHSSVCCTIRPPGYKKVYLSLYKVADTPFHSQGGGGAYYIMKRVDYLTSFTVPSSSIWWALAEVGVESTDTGSWVTGTVITLILVWKQKNTGIIVWSKYSRSPQQTRDVDPMLDRCWAGVEDASRTSTQHWVDVIWWRYIITRFILQMQTAVAAK